MLSRTAMAEDVVGIVVRIPGSHRRSRSMQRSGLGIVRARHTSLLFEPPNRCHRAVNRMWRWPPVSVSQPCSSPNPLNSATWTLFLPKPTTCTGSVESHRPQPSRPRYFIAFTRRAPTAITADELNAGTLAAAACPLTLRNSERTAIGAVKSPEELVEPDERD
jgi:hypothetical protein